MPEHDDQKLFEKLILDGGQAGLICQLSPAGEPAEATQDNRGGTTGYASPVD